MIARVPSHRLVRLVLAVLVGIGGVLSPVGGPGVESVAAASPTPTAPMTVRFEAGDHTGYTFNLTTGAVTGSKQATIGSRSTAQTTQRASIPGRGVHLRISTGTFAGYWVPETIVAHVIGVVGQRTFTPPRAISLPTGRIVAYRFDSGWNLVAAPVLTLTSPSSATASKSAVIDGMLAYWITSGPFANSWLPSGGFHVARTLACHTSPRAGGGTATWSRLTSAGPEVALTFDLGGRTEPGLAIAKRLLLYGVCATIFPTGDTAASSAGNEILEFMDTFPGVFEFGNHTKDHCDLVNGGGDTGCPATRGSSAFVQSQLTSAGSTITAVTGQTTTPYWRPPYGSHDQAVRIAASEVGWKKTVMWDIDTIDWRPPPPTDTGPTTVQIVNKVVSRATNGSIVLMHLGGWNTYASLPSMVHGLRGRGLTPTSLSDLADGS
jgi:peptidoglycan/xylan/chitin deacetylase (PgdA/CDA1 family)